MGEWMVVAVFFVSGVAVQADANLVDPTRAATEEECKAMIPEYAAAIRKRTGAETVAWCRLVPPAPKEKPQGDPRTEKRS